MLKASTTRFSRKLGEAENVAFVIFSTLVAATLTVILFVVPRCVKSMRVCAPLLELTLSTTQRGRIDTEGEHIPGLQGLQFSWCCSEL
jgi:hypothetical protein